MKRIKRKLFMILMVLALVISVLVACGSKKESETQSTGSSSVSYDSAMSESAEEYYAEAPDYDEKGLSDNSSSQFAGNLENQKVIKTGYYYIETLAYEESIQTIRDIVEQFNGYVSNSEESGYGINNREWYTRNAYFIVRVPALSYTAFTEALEDAGQIVNGRDSEQDVTSQFIDVEARLKTLKVQEERLLAILVEADDLQYIIELEKALADVRYQIESYESTMRNLEDRIAYSTVEIRLQEVIEETDLTPAPRTFGERITQGFKQSIDNISDFFVDLTVFLLTASPYLVIIAIVVIFVLTAVVKRLRRDGEKKE